MYYSREEFLSKSTELIISDLMAENYGVESAEISFWVDTIENVKKELNRIKNNVLLAFEYKIPFSAGRIDLVLFYKNAGKFVLNIVELKDWCVSNILAVEKKINPIKVHINVFGDLRYHPSIQLLSYQHTLKTLCDQIENGEIITKCSLVMPNYERKADKFLFTDEFKKYNDKTTFYESYSLLFDFVNSETDIVSTQELQDAFSNIKYKKTCQFTLPSIFENENFKLINDEVFVANDAIRNLEENNNVMIIGPAGSGKTAIGLYVAKHFLNKGFNISYGSASEIKNCFDSQSKGIKRLDGVFKVFGNCVANPLPHTLVILDEAHRMMKYQVDMLSRKLGNDVLTLWLIDDGQSFRKGEDNSSYYIKKIIGEHPFKTLFLGDSQFRCGGDTKYTHFVEDMLNVKSKPISTNDVKICATIGEAVNLFNNWNGGSKGIVASDSWKAGRILIDSFSFETVKDFGVWSNEDIPEVASGYKSQGSQKDCILFLWGNEFVYRKSKGFIIQPEYVKDSAWKYIMQNWGSASSREVEYVISKFKSLYYVLLTRFNKNMFIYCCDDETRNYLMS